MLNMKIDLNFGQSIELTPGSSQVEEYIMNNFSYNGFDPKPIMSWYNSLFE